MTGALELGVFIFLSFLAAVASYQGLRRRQVYGFYRFLAFECLAMLIAWNAGRWFRDPATPHQLVSWFILGGATALAAHGVYVIRSVGRPRHRFVEDTVTVVEVGAYRFIRHPMYASLLFVGWGVFFKGLDLPSACLAILATALWTATARAEERFNTDRLGSAYAEYRRRTKMFIPFIL